MNETTGPIFGTPPDEGAQRNERERSFSSAEQAVNRVADATASTVRDVGMKGEHLREQLLTTQDAWVAGARECVRNHPLASVAVAAGLGLLFSRLMR